MNPENSNLVPYLSKSSENIHIKNCIYFMFYEGLHQLNDKHNTQNIQ